MADSKLAIEISLWTMLAFSVAGLVTAFIMSCRDKSETFETIPDSRRTRRRRRRAHRKTLMAASFRNKKKNGFINNQAAINARCGPKCQHVHPNKGKWATPQQYYPNLPQDPTSCNPLPNRWAQMAPREGIVNQTKKIGGKRYLCNKSCPPPEVACGLNDRGIGEGVMDSVQQAGPLGSAYAVKASSLVPNKCQSSSSLSEGFRVKGKDNFVGDAYMGYTCCGDGSPKLGPAGANGVLSPAQCVAAGGDSFTETASDCVATR